MSEKEEGELSEEGELVEQGQPEVWRMQLLCMLQCQSWPCLESCGREAVVADNNLWLHMSAAALTAPCLPQVSGPTLPQGAPSPIIAAPALPAPGPQPQLERSRPAREDSLHSGRVHSSAQGWRHASSARPHWDGPDWRPGRYAGECPYA